MLKTNPVVKELLAGREVPPTFGAREISADPVWERGFFRPG